MATVIRTLEETRADLFEHAGEGGDSELRKKQRDEFVFHMTDWRDDLRRLTALYETPEAFGGQEAREIVAAFLYHALGHLIAAARLYDYVPDPFGTPTDSRDIGDCVTDEGGGRGPVP